MKDANRIVGVIYLMFLVVLLVGALATISQTPYLPFIILLLGVPVILNWLTFVHWSDGRSLIRQVDLVVSLIYAIFLAAITITGLVRSEYSTLIGVLVFSPPILLNWLSYRNWPERDTAANDS